MIWSSLWWAPWTWLRGDLYEHSLYAAGSLPLWLPIFIPVSQFLFPPTPPWGVGEWMEGLVSRWHLYTDFFFCLQKCILFFFKKKIIKYEAIQTDLKKIIHLLFHYLEGVTFRWNFYSFNFWDSRIRILSFPLEKSVNLLFCHQCYLPRVPKLRILPKFQEHVFKERFTGRRILGGGSPSCVLVTKERSPSLVLGGRHRTRLLKAVGRNGAVTLPKRLRAVAPGESLMDKACII